jgi:hypothetical protein
MRDLGFPATKSLPGLFIPDSARAVCALPLARLGKSGMMADYG